MKDSGSELAPFRTIVLQQIAMKYPQGLKAEEVATMDYTLYCAFRLLYDNLGYSRTEYKRTLGKYVDEEYRASYNKRKREYAATRDRTEEEREVRRAQNRVSYRARGLVIAAETAKACASLPVGVLRGPPRGWKETYESAGNYIDVCRKNKMQMPAIIHGVPLPPHLITKLKDEDPDWTVYPGNQLPDWLLQSIANTRKGKEWSDYLWANTFSEVVLNFLENHKGKVISKRKDFCLCLFHHSNEFYHTFYQDTIPKPGGGVMLPHRRITYVKTKGQATPDAVIHFHYEAGKYEQKTVYNNGKFVIEDMSFTDEQVATAMEGLV